MIYISSCFEFPQNPEVFTFPLEVRHIHNETTGLSLLYWAPAEWKPRSYVGFWVACVYFRRIIEQLWKRGWRINLISWQCQKNKTKQQYLSHTQSCFQTHFDFTSRRVPFQPKCKPLPWRDIFVSSGQVNTVWRIQTECSSSHLPTV